MRVTALVNNAGFGDHGLVHEQDPARLKEMAQLNIGPDLAVYAATTAFVLSFTEALWYEAKGTDLRVLCLSPALTSTEFLDVAGEGAAGRAATLQTPEQVVETAMRTLDGRSTPSVVSGALNRAASNLHRLFPRRLGIEVTAPATSSR